MSSKARILLMSAMGMAISPQLMAATFTNNFNADVPADTAVYGNTVVEATGGVDNSGALKLTKANNGENGAFIINELDPGATVYGFDINFKVRVGGGSATPADGFSINFANDLADAAAGGGVEEGVGSGISFAFDIYNNGGTEGPDFAIKLGGAGNEIARRLSTIAEITTGNNWEPVNIRVNPNGTASLTYKGISVFENVPLRGYQGIDGGRFGFYARTGGLNANQWIDDLQITTLLTPQVGITVQPAPIAVLAGRDAIFSIEAVNTEGATFQWFKNGTAINGATEASYTVTGAAVADSGAKYKVEVRGPNNTVTSQEVTLTVANITPPATADLSLNFDDGQVPAEGFVTGTTTVAFEGGVENSGVLQLTLAEGGQAGAFVINDIDNNAPVYGLTAAFQVRIGEGSVPPADGFSFNYATNITDAPTGELEEGIGNGLTVVFDIYNNGGGEAPAIDVKWNGSVVASTKVPLSFLVTESEYADVLIRLETDGTLDVAYKGTIVHNNVLIPGFSSIEGGRFAFGARTGGSFANQWIDNIQITTENTAGDLRITTAPVAQTALAGRPVTFTAVVNDPTGVTFQWFRNGTAINGATSSSYTIDSAAVADNAATFSVRATRGNLVVNTEPVALTVVNLPEPVNPQVNFNFDNFELPTGTQVYGNAVIGDFGGVGDSGVLKVTDAIGSQAGSFVIPPLESGAEIGAINVSFDLRLGGTAGTPADGISFNWANNLPDGVLPGAEDGGGNGLSITVDTYDSGGGEAPAIGVEWNGVELATSKRPISFIGNDDEYRHVQIRLTQDGKVTVAYNNEVIFNEVQIPNYAPITNGEFMFAARTGGAFENHWVDNIKIRAEKTVGPLRIVTQPADVTLIAGGTASFNVLVSDPATATYRWFRNGVLIQGATTANFTTPALAAGDNGARYTVEVSNAGGPVLSREAVVTVVPVITVSNPVVNFDFEAGQPENTFLLAGVNGGGYVDAGVLHLTDAVNGQEGTFIIPDQNSGGEVSGFTAGFDVLIGGGTPESPADGFSFVWSENLSDSTIFGEAGAGTGLIVSFDIFDNGGGEAPALDVFWNGQEVASRKLPLSVLRTGEAFVPVIVRVEADGTVDVFYNNQVIYSNLQLPDYRPLTAASFGFGGRTGGYNENQWIDNLQIATSTDAGAPRITSIVKSGNNVVITWTGGGQLQAAPSVTGPWTTVVDAGNPATISATLPMQFFRIVR